MSPYAIRTENLSKQYYIGVQSKRTSGLLGQAGAILREPLRRLQSVRRSQMPQYADDSIWALQDVTIDIQQGEVVGIIGHNGAGKSTLLKILSRITPPTTGQARIRGRIAALLEVGTGFHQELTGRENVYLNGTILGMSKDEIDRKLDAIVDFAGVEKYLDTPVKRYSSGMRVRLGFAVAAHLEPDILLVDEVLAVGDLEFQRRSLGKMDEAAQSGRTVIFISHSMQTIVTLCPRTIWLHEGQVRADGQTAEVVRQYTEDSMQAVQQRTSLEAAPRRGSGLFRFQKIELLNSDGESVKSLSIGETLRVRLHYDYDETHSFISMAVWLVIKHETRGPVTILSPNYVPGWDWNEHAPARVIEGAIEQVPWVPGNYFFDAYALFDNEHADHITSAAALIITYGDFYGKPIPVDTNTIYLTPQRWRAASDDHE